MTAKLLCPTGHWLSIDESQEGQRVQCPRCSATIVVPYSSPAAEGERASFKRSAFGAPARPPSNHAATNGAAWNGSAPVGRLPPHVIESEGRIRATNGHASAVAAPASELNGGSSRNGAHAAPLAAVAPLAAIDPAGPAVKSIGAAVATSRPAVKPAAPHWPSPSKAHLAYDAAERAAIEYRNRKPRTYGVSLVIALFALFQVAPIFLEKSFATAPQWAQATLLLAALEIAYAVWIALTPDWAAPQVAMLLFGVISSLYGMALGLCLFAPPSGRVFFDLDQSPGRGPLWFLVMLGGALAVTHFAGWAAFAWRNR